jgi:polyribonucleotide nucleotidyltransferase
MSYVYNFELNNLKENYQINKVAKQANGNCLLTSGNTVLLATVVIDETKRVDEDFLPLTVQYIEKSYAAGKIPGGYIKRETKPGDFETLTARIVDRSLRPLFPKGYRYNTVINILVLSADEDSDLQVLALNAASAALYNSNIPIKKSVSSVRVAKINEEVVINPSISDLANSTLDLYIAGTDEQLLMIEMKAESSKKDAQHNTNEMAEDELIQLVQLAGNHIAQATNSYSKEFDKNLCEQLELELVADNINEELLDYVSSNFDEDIRYAITRMAKSERNIELQNVVDKVLASAPDKDYDFDETLKIVEKVKKSIVRKMILDDKVRADGRGLKDIRDISIETNILPSAHSSCLFTRGQTQALVVATLGGDRDGQMYETLNDKKAKNETFMVHYNFPPFSVGEAGILSAPGRRELGHGNLAKRALAPVLKKDDSQTVRLVSEVLESNGSSSMATVCGGSLALKAANIDTDNLVAGVAMGLVTDEDNYAILTDIMGLEDHDGDMDFKITGTRNGITALQMDIKLGGISLKILEEAFYQAKEGRELILEKMEVASDEIVLGDNLPAVEIFYVDSFKIPDIIGQGGKVIKELIEEFGVSIDLDRDSGAVKVASDNSSSVSNAKEKILSIVNKSKSQAPLVFDKIYSEGEIYNGVVKRICDFGAFIELPKGGDGLMHISKISAQRVNKVEDVLSIDDIVEVRILKVSKNKIELVSTNF